MKDEGLTPIIELAGLIYLIFLTVRHLQLRVISVREYMDLR